MEGTTTTILQDEKMEASEKHSFPNLKCKS